MRETEDPIVLISSYPPRGCGIGTFCEEAREFIQKRFPERPVYVIAHTDASGEGVFPIIDMKNRTWWKAVARKAHELHPYAIHIQHEYGLYEYRDDRGVVDTNEGFLDLLDALNDLPVIIEPHTIHGRLREAEAEFIHDICERADLVLFKCHYQKWRLEWNFISFGWKVPKNIMIIPHGARPDKRWRPEEIPQLREDLGLDKKIQISTHLVGLIGWIQSNKRWDILTSMWAEIAEEIKNKTGQDWDLLAAGTWRDPNHLPDYNRYKQDVEILEKLGHAHYYEFVPRGDVYYKVMALCDFIVLPSIDETQSGTLARIISLNKPYITTAPMEGLTAQTIESEGGLLFSNKKMLKGQVIRMACDEDLRLSLGNNLKKYLDEVVSWEVVANQYAQAYDLARTAKKTGTPIDLPLEF
jgi:glycosyltransferase involved in cell wall biosynthesis